MPLVTTVEPDGDALRDRRERRGLTQQQLGDLAQCSGSYVSAIERGRDKRVGRTVVSRLAMAMESELEDLIKKAA